MGYLSDYKAKKLICELGRRAYTNGYVCGWDGNITIKVSDNTVWCTPSGVSKGFLKPKNLVKVDFDGNVIGKGTPSSEVKMHLKIYNENSDVTSVVHAHPAAGTSFAIAKKPLDGAMIAENVVYLGHVPVAPYATPSTVGVADSVSGFANEYNACFLSNHGVLTWGDDEICMDGFYRLECLEQTCKMYINLNGSVGDYDLMDKEDVEKLYRIRGFLGYMRGGVLRTK